MSDYEIHSESLDGFSGQTRLFPLPNSVLFPHVAQPLHIFERRYREMLEDCLAGDELFTMALLAPGWEKDYEGRPPVAPVACLGRVLTHQRLDNGTYNLLLAGMSRVRILSEDPPQRSFRIARAELLKDVYSLDAEAERGEMTRKLLDQLRELVGDASELASEQIERLRSRQAPLGILTDILAYSWPLKLDQKQSLLAECNVDRRAKLLLEWTATMNTDPPKGLRPPYPFDVSDN